MVATGDRVTGWMMVVLVISSAVVLALVAFETGPQPLGAVGPWVGGAHLPAATGDGGNYDIVNFSSAYGHPAGTDGRGLMATAGRTGRSDAKEGLSSKDSTRERSTLGGSNRGKTRKQS